MKTAIIATAVLVLSIISTSHSLPLGSSNPEDAQPVIPLAEKPLQQELPTSVTPEVKSELKPEESVAAAVAEPEKKIKESKSAEPELKAIEEKAAIVQTEAAEKPKEAVDVVAAEATKAAEPISNIARSAEPEIAAKAEETPVAPAIAEAEKPVAEAEGATKGFFAAAADVVTGAVLKAEDIAESMSAKEAPATELKSEAAPAPAAKEETPIVPQPEIKEERTIPEAQVSTVAEEAIKKTEEIIPAEEKPKAAEIHESEPIKTEERSKAGSEVAVEAQEEKELEKEKEKELPKEEEPSAKVEEKEIIKEEAKKELEVVKQEEPALEEAKNPIKAEELPVAQQLAEPSKKTESPKNSSEESSEEDRSPEDKNAVKNEENSSQEQSDEDSEKSS